ncbi:hypothetical protein NBT05_02380 [Aquimarina sp. ERC-38]|uniref:ligand-binding sensor domain-containing protein n=1 Tax=Aquimarina sp. ERC-38 TaxID=2949996 RepID=UPI0022455855|nr:two-component regulator propeller domain-containing protein [Aquimarina sp. ERC-38]UZO81331.1 hypothetical protein NBT05_02380 [Aquimarina sp. ERC-38]
MILRQFNWILFLTLMFAFTFCNGQEKKDLPKGAKIITDGSSKLVKTHNTHSGNIHNSLQDRNGKLWFATSNDGVYRYDGKTFTNFTTKDELNSNTVLSILEDKNGDIWFGTDYGISRFDGKSISCIPSSVSQVFSMLEGKNGKLWFGTNRGVYCYDGIAFTSFLSTPNPYGLNLSTVNRMLEDKNGNIWFTTKMEGVCMYDGKSVISYKPNDETYFWGLLEDHSGNIWVGGRNKGVWRYDGRTFVNILQNGKFDSYLAFDIIQDKTGNIWFGTEAINPSQRKTEGGVWVYNGKNFKNFSKKDGLSHNAVFSILEDKVGNLWMGTRNTGLTRYDGKNFTSFSE